MTNVLLYTTATSEEMTHSPCCV